ncbi:L-threonylcarbamoyladenylate synthase [Radicibacter daui]|uniref:L-threonylcarbamoyladenylate synthase n=1 Tax=Radicibacter daui TaxID=3064829 RepID=UPI004046F75D
MSQRATSPEITAPNATFEPGGSSASPYAGEAALPAADQQLLPPDRVEEAAAALRAGKLVAFATETVYGLGGDATNDSAVAAIFAAKGRPSFNPLIVHVPDRAAAEPLAIMTPLARKLADAFWPGPVTLVLPRAADCPASLLVSAGLDSIAIRVPAHPLARKLLRAVGRPIAAPSANRSGSISPTEAAHVIESLGANVNHVLDGGACAVGLESTVVDCTGAHPVLLRHGGLALETLARIVPDIVETDPEQPDAPRSPGQLLSHYAPEKPLRLHAGSVQPEEALLAFGPDVPEGAAAVLNLSATGDLVEAAAHLFAFLRQLDAGAGTAIAAMPIPETGLGRAINDRLRRAAAPRDPTGLLARAAKAGTTP